MKTYNCLNCGKSCTHGHSKTNKFCSNQCQRDYIFLTETLLRFEQCLVVERKTMRRCLAHLRGYKCEVCGISDYNGRPITLQVDHINGNPGDHRPSNLQLLCPNCHSQTEFFSGANKGNGRKSRGLPLN